MKQEKVFVKVVPDIRRKKDGKRFPLKLRITYKGIRNYYGVGYDATIEEWKIINSADAKGSLRKIKNSILNVENEAQECCDQITPFLLRNLRMNFFTSERCSKVFKPLIKCIYLS